MSPGESGARELVPGVEIGGRSLPVVAGPCVIEDEETTLVAAGEVAAIARRLKLQVVFKASFDKANRSSMRAFRGPGLQQGLRILGEVRRRYRLPLVTDVHEPGQCEAVASVVDMLQIPAFLCRQTDLLLAAAKTGRPINVKKGQFMAPDDMRRVVDKLRSAGNDLVTVTERGSSFGYHNLVVDMRAFEWMQRDGIHVLYDVTHSLQLPGAGADGSSGQRDFAEPLARAAVAAGADGLFLEIHPNPEAALSDRDTQLSPTRAEALLASVLPIRAAVLESRRESRRESKPLEARS